MFVASLFGPVSCSSEARSWLCRAHLADGDAAADRLLAAHDRLYPARTEPHAERVLPPLTPDRFAEDFIADHLRQPRAVELLGELLADGETGPAATRQCLIMLAAAARYPAVCSVLFNLLEARPQLATHATPPVLRVVINHASPALAAVVAGALPRYSTELLRPARDLAQHLLDTLPPSAPAAQRAHRLNNLGIRLAEVGDKRAALDPTQEAVDIRRRLAGAEPAAYLPALASALNNMGVLLCEVGDERAALDPTREATGIYRRLADAEPAAYLPDLAMSLWAYAWVRAAGELELSPALDAAARAVEIYQQLAQQLPAAFEQNLAAAIRTREELADALAHTEDATIRDA